MPLYHSVIISLAKQPPADFAASLRKCCHGIFKNGGWVRAVENHGLRPLPFRVRSKYLPEDERYQKNARYVSLYYDAPVSARMDLELTVRLDEKILRFNTLRLESIVDEVLSKKPSNPWNQAAGLKIKTQKPKTKKLGYGESVEDNEPDRKELDEFVEKYF
mmetsp:Transcript_9730/g.12788  ORF Transcript_9730/g.12788 Transcript_9730/m.12788 type:complete len:161 (-) Transcript_9730:146-628(-)